jgi:hypothetical protein
VQISIDDSKFSCFTIFREQVHFISPSKACIGGGIPFRDGLSHQSSEITERESPTKISAYLSLKLASPLTVYYHISIRIACLMRSQREHVRNIPARSSYLYHQTCLNLSKVHCTPKAYPSPRLSAIKSVRPRVACRD